jgi:hypothetical protein
MTLKIPANQRAVERFERMNPATLWGDHTAAERVQIIRILDAHGVNASRVSENGFEIVPGGVVIAEFVVGRTGARVLRHRGTESSRRIRVRGRFVATPRTGA